MDGKVPTWLRHWEITREKGKWKFILQNGIFAWGLPMFILMTFFVDRPTRPLTLSSIAISILIWAVTGAAFGWAVWITTERKYQEFLVEHALEPTNETSPDEAANGFLALRPNAKRS